MKDSEGSSYDVDLVFEYDTNKQKQKQIIVKHDSSNYKVCIAKKSNDNSKQQSIELKTTFEDLIFNKKLIPNKHIRNLWGGVLLEP